MRNKLKEINRCDACLMFKDIHGDSCTIYPYPCNKCKSNTHVGITCDKISSDGSAHPGSWILNLKNRGSAIVSEAPIFFCNAGLTIETSPSMNASLTAQDTYGDLNVSGVVVIDFFSIYQKRFRARALLDSGSGTNFVNKEILPFLQHESLGSRELELSGINSTLRDRYELVRIFIFHDRCPIKTFECYVHPGPMSYNIEPAKYREVVKGEVH